MFVKTLNNFSTQTINSRYVNPEIIGASPIQHRSVEFVVRQVPSEFFVHIVGDVC